MELIFSVSAVLSGIATFCYYFKKRHAKPLIQITEFAAKSELHKNSRCSAASGDKVNLVTENKECDFQTLGQELIRYLSLAASYNDKGWIWRNDSQTVQKKHCQDSSQL